MMPLAIAARRVSVEWAAVVSAAGAALLVALAVLVAGMGPLLHDLGRLGLPMLGLFALLMLWQLGWRFLRWLFLARRLGLPMSPSDSLVYYGAGLGMALTPGRIGEMLRIWLIQKHYRAPYRRLTALYLADRAGDAAAYLLMLALAMGLRAQGTTLRWAPLLVFGCCLAAAFYPQPALGALTIVYRATRRFKRTLLWLRRLVRNTAMLFRPAVFLPALAMGFVGWCAAPIVLALALSRMGVSLDPVHAAAIYASGALTGGASMLPGGGGSTEAVIVALLLAAGVSLDAAIAATLAVRVAFLWLPIALGFVILPVAMARARRVAPA